ncbi:MAG TPA: hypothetical protein VGG12_00215 [Methylovirgula sp.]
MTNTWNTKYGTRRVRHDPPTLKEAIIAAQGLTDQLNEQVEIAAALMDVPAETVRAEIQKQMPNRVAGRIVTPATREAGARTVIVERKAARRVVRPNQS